MDTSSTHLLDFISQATSPFHVVKAAGNELAAAGFQLLPWEEDWKLERGGRYYTPVHGTTLFAFTIGDRASEESAFRIVSAHTDHPCLHIKPSAEYAEHGYLRLNVDCYGGLIKNTWMDRPLSIAGKAALKSPHPFHPATQLVDFKRPLLTIPNLAIHMNREINKGVELNSQLHMLPLLGRKNATGPEKPPTEEAVPAMNDFRIPKASVIPSPNDSAASSIKTNGTFFTELLAQELSCSPEDILDFDLYLYNQEDGCLLGMNREFISAPRLDNLTSVVACLHGIQYGSCPDTISLIALYDNEEIGSRTKQGADSTITNLLLQKIVLGLLEDDRHLTRSILKSHMISMDVAHGFHPNYTGSSDPTNTPELSQGFCIKINSNQKYATDTEAIAAVMQICQHESIPFQKYVNRSDLAGGSTLGSLSSSWLPMPTVDLGIPLLAMHSARELMAACDQDALNQFSQAFFTLPEFQ